MFLLRRTALSGVSRNVFKQQLSEGYTPPMRTSILRTILVPERGFCICSARLSDALSGSGGADDFAPSTGPVRSLLGQQSSFNGTAGQDSPELPPTRQIYVGNLFFSATEDALKAEMSRFGEIKHVKIVYDRRGMSKGFGFVDFADVESAIRAKQEMSGQIFQGRVVTIQFTRARSAGEQARPAQNPPSKTLFVGNLSYEMTDRDLNDLFRNVENVTDVRVAIDRRTGQPRGFAHADFTNVESAEKAFQQLSGKELYDRKLRIDYSAHVATAPPSARDPSQDYSQDPSRGVTNSE